MLGDWVEQCWSEAGEEQRLAFDRLLEIEDDRLWEWLAGRSLPATEFQDIVEAIRARHFGFSGQ